MLNQGWTYTDRIQKQPKSQTVLDYYSQRYRHSTEQEWHDRISTQEIKLNNKPTTPNTILKSGDVLTYDRPPWEEPDVPLEFDLHYEDEDLLVISKPSGLPVMPGGGFLENTLLRLLERSYPQNPPIPIHRLGRGTSGLMILARSAIAKSILTKQMRDRSIRKIYLALASGIIESNHFEIHQPIGKIAHPILGELFAATHDGLTAESHVTVLEHRDDSTLCSVEIFTGRPHQIRIHLASVGHPLVGDSLYGQIKTEQKKQSPWTREIENMRIVEMVVPGDCGYHLHAHQLEFLHPRSQQCLSFTAIPRNPLLNPLFNFQTTIKEV